MMKKPQFKITKRFWIQVAAIIVLILLGVLMFVIGKQHTILLDNKTLETETATYRALPEVTVQVDKGEKIELAARDRDQAIVVRQGHTVTVWYEDPKTYEERELKIKFRVPLSENMMLMSIPALVNGADESVWLTHYEIAVVTSVASEEEAIVTSEDAALLGEF